jgi:hypothetical protein
MMSVQACQHAAKDFEALFYPTYQSAYWRVAGAVRRLKEADHLVHVVIPRDPTERGACHGVWQRAHALLSQGVLQLWEYPGMPYKAPESDATVAAFGLRGIRHEVYLANKDNWASRLTEHTGPPGYWRMLVHRLKLEGSLTLSNGNVCAIDRSLEPNRLEVIPCADEHRFFLLARTVFKAPQYRFERPQEQPDDVNNWERGILEPWYPPGIKPYADPRQTYLFDASRPVSSRFSGRNARIWRHT